MFKGDVWDSRDSFIFNWAQFHVKLFGGFSDDLKFTEKIIKIDQNKDDINVS